MNYLIESIDNRPHYHKEKLIKKVIHLEITHKHYIFTTSKNKKIKLRTDTWKMPVFIKIKGD